MRLGSCLVCQARKDTASGVCCGQPMCCGLHLGHDGQDRPRPPVPGGPTAQARTSYRLRRALSPALERAFQAPVFNVSDTCALLEALAELKLPLTVGVMQVGGARYGDA